MVFMLTPLGASSVIFANSIVGKAYMTGRWRLSNPDGAPGNPVFENDCKAQLNEAEWSPLLVAGLLCSHVHGNKAPAVAATLCATASVWYLWSRILLVAKNGTPVVVVGGIARYIGGTLLALQLIKALKT